MSVQATDCIDAATHLPAGGRLTLYDVGWEEYQQLLVEIGDRSHLRISYDEGRLEIMSPSARHEQYKNLMHDFVVILSDEIEQDVISFGSVTLKLEPRAKGAEGDDCFYVQHATMVVGKDKLDLANDPPPDLVIEINFTRESTNKFSIYASLGVPEIWHYDGRHWKILKITGQTYEPASCSLAFPFISGLHMTRFVEQSERESSFKARRTFRNWVKANRPQELA